jgi:hypothetical protein
LLVVLGVLPLVPLFMTRDQVFRHGWVLYLCALVAANIVFWLTPDHARTYFSPSALMVNFTLLWFLLGSMGFRFGWITFSPYARYYSFAHLDIATSFFLAAVFASVVAMLVGYRRSIRLPFIERGEADNRLMLVSAVGLLAFAFIPLSLAVFDGGDFSTLLSTAAAVGVAYVVSARRRPIRYGAYLLLLIFLAVTIPQNKRMFFFFFVVVALLELRSQRRFRFSVRAVVATLAGIAVLGAGVLTMSIQRGHGQLGTTNAVDSFFAIPRYFTSVSVVDTLYRNFEWSYAYFHSVDAVDYVATYPSDLLLGETYAKALLVAVPRRLAPFKPDNFIGFYTERIDPELRARGGSLPPNAYSEAFGNFHYLGGVAAIFAVFSVLNRAFNGLVDSLRSRRTPGNALYLAMFLLLLEYFRGFGLDGFAAHASVVALAYLAMILAAAALPRRLTADRGGPYSGAFGPGESIGSPAERPPLHTAAD